MELRLKLAHNEVTSLSSLFSHTLNIIVTSLNGFHHQCRRWVILSEDASWFLICVAYMNTFCYFDLFR